MKTSSLITKIVQKIKETIIQITWKVNFNNNNLKDNKVNFQFHKTLKPQIHQLTLFKILLYLIILYKTWFLYKEFKHQIYLLLLSFHHLQLLIY